MEHVDREALSTRHKVLLDRLLEYGNKYYDLRESHTKEVVKVMYVQHLVHELNTVIAQINSTAASDGKTLD